MNKSTRFIVTAAALAGLYAGSLATRAYADGQAGSGDSSKDASKDALLNKAVEKQPDLLGGSGSVAAKTAETAKATAETAASTAAVAVETAKEK